jgi:hypothetical protein
MRPLIKLTIFAAVLFSNFSCRTRKPNNYSSLHIDSGVQRASYGDQMQTMKSAVQKYPALLSLNNYGNSVKGQPLMALKLKDATVTNSTHRKSIVITEAIHGHEYLHITDRLVMAFAAKAKTGSVLRSFLSKGGIIYLVPIYNPDGYIAGQRENANGADLNRDFPAPDGSKAGMTQPETKYFHDFVMTEASREGSSIDLLMEYHCCLGGVIHPWAYTDKSIEESQLSKLRQVGEITKKIFGYPYGTVSELLNYSGVGGTIDFIQKTFASRAFSFEGKSVIEEQNLSKHLTLYDEIMTLI